jgi:hypothetical protein
MIFWFYTEIGRDDRAAVELSLITFVFVAFCCVVLCGQYLAVFRRNRNCAMFVAVVFAIPAFLGLLAVARGAAGLMGILSIDKEFEALDILIFSFFSFSVFAYISISMARWAGK